MGATRIEFQLRVWIIVGIIALGFWAPWIAAWGIGQRISLLEWLALEVSRLGWVSFAVATPLLVVVAALLAAVAAVLRVWGTAYLGPGTVQHGSMQAGAVLADGPYRFVRNPLYLGNWFMFAVMALLMPVSGAICAMVLLTIFLLRLILAEEAYLTGGLGQPYLDYRRAVPRLIPLLRTRLVPTGRKPHWGRALLAELCPIGIFLTLAFLSWNYDYRLMVRAILISFGVSLVARALTPGITLENSRAE